MSLIANVLPGFTFLIYLILVAGVFSAMSFAGLLGVGVLILRHRGVSSKVSRDVPGIVPVQALDAWRLWFVFVLSALGLVTAVGGMLCVLVLLDLMSPFDVPLWGLIFIMSAAGTQFVVLRAYRARSLLSVYEISASDSHAA